MAALLRASSRTVSKALGDQTRGYKVAVLGAAGGIGQPCGLLMKMVRAAIVPPFHISPKPSGDRWAIRPDLAHPTLTFLPFPPPQNPLVTELSLYDIAGTPGVAADVSHVNTAAQTKVRAPI